MFYLKPEKSGWFQCKEVLPGISSISVFLVCRDFLIGHLIFFVYIYLTTEREKFKNIFCSSTIRFREREREKQKLGSRMRNFHRSPVHHTWNINRDQERFWYLAAHIMGFHMCRFFQKKHLAQCWLFVLNRIWDHG